MNQHPHVIASPQDLVAAVIGWRRIADQREQLTALLLAQLALVRLIDLVLKCRNTTLTKASLLVVDRVRRHTERLRDFRGREPTLLQLDSPQPIFRTQPRLSLCHARNLPEPEYRNIIRQFLINGTVVHNWLRVCSIRGGVKGLVVAVWGA